MSQAEGFMRAKNLHDALDGAGHLVHYGPLRAPHVVVLMEPGTQDRGRLVAFMAEWPEGSWRILDLDPLPSHDRCIIVTRNLTAEMLRQR